MAIEVNRVRYTLGALGLAATIGAALGVAMPWEGRQLVAHFDPVRIPTICGGITRGVKIGDVATSQECDAKEQLAMLEALETVSRCAPGVKLSINEWAAWGSFTYNVGPGRKGVKDGFCVLKSGSKPTLLKKLLAGDYTGACNELPKWVGPLVNGKPLKGIVLRRADELAVCLGGSSSLQRSQWLP